MAEQSSPTVEIAPTVIVSNSSESPDNANLTDDSGENPGERITGDGAGTEGLSSHDNGSGAEDGTPPIVAVAEIEAGRDIALAEIGAQIERERIELQSERGGELEECHREIQELRETVTALQEAVSLLTLPPVLEEVVEEALEIVPETNLTEPSTAAPTIETMTEPSEESVEEKPVEEIPTARVRRFTAI